MTDMVACLQAEIMKSEQNVATHQHYQESLQGAVDWLSQMKDKLSLCSDSTGDRTTIQNKLDRLQVSGERVSRDKEADFWFWGMDR